METRLRNIQFLIIFLIMVPLAALGTSVFLEPVRRAVAPEWVETAHAIMFGCATALAVLASVGIHRIMVSISSGRDEGAGCPTRSGRRAWVVSVTILAIGLCISGVAAHRSEDSLRHEAHGLLVRLTERVAHEIERRVNHPRNGLAGARGMYMAGGGLTRGQFAAYVGSRDLASEFPGALGFGVIKRVRRDELSAFEEKERRDGCEDFRVYGLGAPDSALNRTDELYVIKHCYPEARNRRAWGLDVGSEPIRREAIQRAIDTGEPTISAAITLVQDDRSAVGFLYYLPVYARDTRPTTAEERRKALDVVLYAPMLLDEAVDDVAATTHGMLDFEVFDGTHATSEKMLYDHDGHLSRHVGSVGQAEFSSRLFSMQSRLSIGGRTWTMFTSTTPAFEESVDHTISMIVVCFGLVVSALGAGFAHALLTSRASAMRLAESMTRDLQAAKRAADKAMLEAQIYQSVLHEHAIVSIADCEGRITHVNPNFCKISGYTREEVLGEDHRIVNSRTHPKQFFVDMWRTIASGDAWRGEICNRRKDGTLYWVDSIVAPFTDMNDKIERYVSIRTDITTRKSVEEQLITANRELRTARQCAEAANEVKSLFLANMSHEIRTPLTAILGYADLLQNGQDYQTSADQRRAAVETIRRAGQHLLAVINDILDLSKIEADRMTVESVETPLLSVMHDVESLIGPKCKAKNVRLESTLRTPIPERIMTDPTRLRQILMNLVGNAAKFTEEGGVSVGVGVERLNDEPRVVVDVEDTGPGLTEEQASRLFQAFGQADITVTRRHGGTGLGLVICRRLAALMGGDVKLMRTAPGKGSCFRLTLPLEAAPGARMIDRTNGIVQANTTERGQQAATTLKGRILLAEDGLDNQRLIAFHLRKAGAEVDLADNGRIALVLLEEAESQGKQYDLLVTDMQMPELDGYELARTIRRQGSRLAIVALTAHAMAEDRGRCIDAGCDDYASKPIDRAALLSVCAKWMGKPGGVVSQAAAA